MQSSTLRMGGSKRLCSDCRSEEGGWERLARELTREFRAPIGIFDLQAGRWYTWYGASPSDYPEVDRLAAAVLEHHSQRSGRIQVVRSTAEWNRVWLEIFFELGGRGSVAAVAPFHAPAADSTTPYSDESTTTTTSTSAREFGRTAALCGPLCPEPALRAWGEQVAGRVYESMSFGGGTGRPTFPTAAEHLVLGRLIRRMKISDHPQRFQALTANVVRTSLGVEAVAWVPADGFEAVVVSGEVTGFSDSDYRTLAPASLKESAFVAGPPHGERGRVESNAVRRYAVVTGGSSGWLIAVNPSNNLDLDEPELEILQFAASLITAQLNNAKIYGDLKELLFGIIRALTSAIDAKDPYTCGHSERVARIAVRLAEQMGVTPQKRSDIYLAGLLHDIGKIGIDDEVLKKPGRLSPEEYRRIQSHVEIGVTILNDLRKLHHILPGVRHHHESHDGTGYPDRLSGEEIPIEARILAVADSFDAMSSNRPYRRRLTSLQINEIFRQGSGVQWDPQVVEALFACRMDVEAIRQKGLGESLLGAVDVTLGRR